MDIDTIIRQLEYEADKHKNDRLFTGQTDIASLCRDLIPKMKELKRYEDLEQGGRLLELPCKVGDVLYLPIDFQNKIYVGRCIGLEYSRIRKTWVAKVFTEEGESREAFKDFGKTVFLSKEAAEATLKEMEGKVDE